MSEYEGHTPGPWHARLFKARGEYQIMGPTKNKGMITQIASVRFTSCDKANAALIAAAPDLAARVEEVEAERDDLLESFQECAKQRGDALAKIARLESDRARLVEACNETLHGWDNSPVSETTGLEATFYDGIGYMRDALAAAEGGNDNDK